MFSRSVCECDDDSTIANACRAKFNHQKLARYFARSAFLLSLLVVRVVRLVLRELSSNCLLTVADGSTLRYEDLLHSALDVSSRIRAIGSVLHKICSLIFVCVCVLLDRNTSGINAGARHLHRF